MNEWKTRVAVIHKIRESLIMIILALKEINQLIINRFIWYSKENVGFLGDLSYVYLVEEVVNLCQIRSVKDLDNTKYMAADDFGLKQHYRF